MARTATTTDVFNAIGELRRRQILDLLSEGQPWAVLDVVARLKLGQPTVSKHLAVLRKVGLVSVEKAGQNRFYQFHAEELKPVHDWVRNYERYWTHHHPDKGESRAESRKSHLKRSKV